MLSTLKCSLSSHNVNIILPEPVNNSVLTAMIELYNENVFVPKILRRSKEFHESASGIPYMDTENSPEKSDLVNLYYDSRQYQGLSVTDAWEDVSNPVAFGTMMMKAGSAGAMMLSNDGQSGALPESFIKSAYPKGIPLCLPCGDILFSEKDNPDENNVLLFMSADMCRSASEILPEDFAEGFGSFLEMFTNIFHSDFSIAFLTGGDENVYRCWKSIIPLINSGKTDNKRKSIILNSELFKDVCNSNALPKVFVFPDIQSRLIALQVATCLGRFSRIGTYYSSFGKPVAVVNNSTQVDEFEKTAVFAAAMSM